MLIRYCSRHTNEQSMTLPKCIQALFSKIFSFEFVYFTNTFMSLKGILFVTNVRVKQIKPLYKFNTLVYFNCFLKQKFLMGTLIIRMLSLCVSKPFHCYCIIYFTKYYYSIVFCILDTKRNSKHEVQ